MLQPRGKSLLGDRGVSRRDNANLIRVGHRFWRHFNLWSLMPILPLDSPEPFAATLGVMLYPGAEEGEPQKAAAFASQYLASPSREARRNGFELRHQDLALIAEKCGAVLGDLDERWWAGSATGEVFKVLFALHNTDQRLASWNNATKIAEAVAGRLQHIGSRSKLMTARSAFSGVAHLWAAWVIREGKFHQEPEIGYDFATDFQFFLTEAEILRSWGQSWVPARAKAEHPLPKEVWRVPDDWTPPMRHPSWPHTGKIPHLSLSDDLLNMVKPAGRPKKSA